VLVRRALVAALAERIADATAPSRKTTLTEAARLDPDAQVRFIASRALEGRVAELRSAPVPEIAWMRLTEASGKAPPAGGEPFLAALVRSDGLAVPFAFDDDGYAHIPGVPPGEARVIFTPRVPEAPR
jgi:hypothetical protein